MKKITLYFISIVLLCTVLISCNDDDTANSGNPELVSVTSTTDFNIPLTSCNLGDWVVLHGKNLHNISNIVINGVEVNMREAFLESEKVTLQIPRALPADGEPTNAIKITNGDYAVELGMDITIPQLYLTGLDNEWALIGDTVKINGANFDIYAVTAEKSQIHFGDVPAKITETTASYVSVIVPEGSKRGSRITIQSDAANMTVPGLYCDDRNLFEGFEGGFGWAGTDNMVTDGTKEGDIPSCNGKYLRIHRDHDGGWFAFIANGYVWPEEMWNNPEEWCLKFEIATNKAINKKFVQFDQTKYIWEPWSATEFNTYGKWKTITLEMTDVLKDGYTQNPNDGFLFQLSLNGGDNEAVDFSLDNYRLYHKE